MTFEWFAMPSPPPMLLSAIPPTVAHSIALLAGDPGRSYTTDFLRNGEQSADNPDFTVCIIRCVYLAELILGRSFTYRIRIPVLQYKFIKGTFMSHECTRDQYPFNGQMRTGMGPALV